MGCGSSNSAKPAGDKPVSASGGAKSNNKDAAGAGAGGGGKGAAASASASASAGPAVIPRASLEEDRVIDSLVAKKLAPSKEVARAFEKLGKLALLGSGDKPTPAETQALWTTYSSGGSMDANGLQRLYSDMMESAMEIDWVPEEARAHWRNNKSKAGAIAANLFRVIDQSGNGTVSQEEFQINIHKCFQMRKDEEEPANPVERCFAKFGKIALGMDDLPPTEPEWDALWQAYSADGSMDAAGLERMYTNMMEGSLTLSWVPKEFKDKWTQQLKPNVGAVVQNIIGACHPSSPGKLTRDEFQVGFLQVLQTRS